MLADARLVAAKDLRIEWRSRVVTNQVAPFAALVLVLFAFALDVDTPVLTEATGGLFWVTVLLASLLAVQRAFGLEVVDGNREALRLSGLGPGAVFAGKVVALMVQLAVLEALLLLGVVVLYGTELRGVEALAPTMVLATAGIAAAGAVYGVLAASLNVRETLLPVLLLPVLAPVLIAGTEAFDAALHGQRADAWPWVGLLGVFAGVYAVFGSLAFGPLLEDS